MCIYTIPAGKTGILLDIHGMCSKVTGVANPAADMKLLVRQYGGVFRTQDAFEFTDTFFKHEYLVPFNLPPKTDIVIRAQTVKDNNTALNAGFQIMFI